MRKAGTPLCLLLSAGAASCDEPGATYEVEPLDTSVAQDINRLDLSMLKDGSSDAGHSESPEAGLAFPPGPCEVRFFCIAGECPPGEYARYRFTYGDNRLPMLIEGLYQDEVISVSRRHYRDNLLVDVETDYIGENGQPGIDGMADAVLTWAYDDQSRVIESARVRLQQRVSDPPDMRSTMRYLPNGQVDQITWELTHFNGAIEQIRHRYQYEGDTITIIAEFDDGNETRAVYHFDAMGHVIRRSYSRSDSSGEGYTTWLFHPPARMAAAVTAFLHGGLNVTRYEQGTFGPKAMNTFNPEDPVLHAYAQRGAVWAHGVRGEVIRQMTFARYGEDEEEEQVDHSCWSLGDERPGCGDCPPGAPVCREGVYCAECDPRDGSTCPFQRPVCIDGRCYGADTSIDWDGYRDLFDEPYFYP